MMNHRAALETAKGMLERGELADVAAANVEVVRMMGILVVSKLPRDVRLAYIASVKEGRLGRLAKKGLAPEIFFHPNARGTAIAMQERLFHEAIAVLKKVYTTPEQEP